MAMLVITRDDPWRVRYPKFPRPSITIQVIHGAVTAKNHPGLFDQMGNIGCFKDPFKVFLVFFGLVYQDPFGFTVFYPSFLDVLEKLGNHQTRQLHISQLQSSRRRRDPCRKITSTSENIHLNMVNPGTCLLLSMGIPQTDRSAKTVSLLVWFP